MGYSRRTLNYLKRIALSGLTYMMSMYDLVAIGRQTLNIDSGYFVDEEFTKLIHLNP